MGDNNLSTAVDGNVIAASIVNQYKIALGGDIIPRAIDGVINNAGSDLGSDANRFRDAHISRRVYQAGSFLIPVGMIAPFAGASSPSGWLFTNGDTIGNVNSTATHRSEDLEDLFNILKIAYGNLGTENFANGDSVKLPDTRGRFLRDLDKSKGLDSGRTLGSNQAGQNESHGHSLRQAIADPAGGTSPVTIAAPKLGSAVMNGENYNFTSAVPSTHSIAASGGNESRPVNIAVNYIIKW